MKSVAEVGRLLRRATNELEIAALKQEIEENPLREVFLAMCHSDSLVDLAAQHMKLQECAELPSFIRYLESYAQRSSIVYRGITEFQTWTCHGAGHAGVIARSWLNAFDGPYLKWSGA